MAAGAEMARRQALEEGLEVEANALRRYATATQGSLYTAFCIFSSKLIS